jgi:hypothetical protein
VIAIVFCGRYDCLQLVRLRPAAAGGDCPFPDEKKNKKTQENKGAKKKKRGHGVPIAIGRSVAVRSFQWCYGTWIWGDDPGIDLAVSPLLEAFILVGREADGGGGADSLNLRLLRCRPEAASPPRSFGHRPCSAVVPGQYFPAAFVTQGIPPVYVRGRSSCYYGFAFSDKDGRFHCC